MGENVKQATTESDSKKTEDIEDQYEFDSYPSEDKVELSEDELKKVILVFLESRDVGPVAENSLKNSVKLDGEMITIELTNPIEVDGIEKVRAEFLNFVRRKFQNSGIQLQHKVNIEKAADRPYTAKDKFEAMLKENPLLGRLRDTFGLDTDY